MSLFKTPRKVGIVVQVCNSGALGGWEKIIKFEIHSSDLARLFFGDKKKKEGREEERKEGRK